MLTLDMVNHTHPDRAGGILDYLVYALWTAVFLFMLGWYA